MWKHIADVLAVAWLTAAGTIGATAAVFGVMVALDYLYTNHYPAFIGGAVGFTISATCLSVRQLFGKSK